jgi:hypothetical protein
MVERSLESHGGSNLGKAPAGVRDELFRKMPEPIVLRDYSSEIRLRPGEISPYARIFGSIPGDESDEEFAAAVEELS